jgi:hypothetical protein
MTSRKKLFPAVLLAALSFATNAHAWTQNWQNATPYSYSIAISGNTVGADISNNTGHGVEFFNSKTGVPFCTDVPDPNLYGPYSPTVYATQSGNLFLAFFQAKTTLGGSIAKMNVQAYRVDVPTPGVTPTCTPIWTWQTPFTFPFGTLVQYVGFLAGDGNMAGLMIVDGSTNRLRTYTLDVNTGAMLATVDDPSGGAIASYIAGASPNAQYAFAGGRWVRSIDHATGAFGPALASGGAIVSASMSDSGYLIETSFTGITLKHDNLDPTHNILVSDFSVGLPTGMFSCLHVAVSYNGQIAGLSCNSQNSNQLFAESFSIPRSAAQHTLVAYNSASYTSPATNLTFKTNKIVATDSGRAFFATEGDANVAGGSAPEAFVLPLTGGTTDFQAIGSAMDISANSDAVWMYTLNFHDTAGTFTGGNVTLYVNP